MGLEMLLVALPKSKATVQAGLTVKSYIVLNKAIIQRKSNLIFTFAAADGLLRIHPDATGLSAGEVVEVVLI